MNSTSAGRKRILFLSHYFPPEGNAPASRVHEMCRRWVGAGHSVTVVTCAPNVPDGVLYPGYRNRLTQREWVDGIEVVRVWTFLAANAGFSRRIMNYVSYMLCATLRALFLQRPDVIIATSPQFFCGWSGVLLKWFRRRPLILEVRDIWPESIQAVGAIRSRPLLRFLEWLERRMYAAATHVVTVGDGYRERLLKRSVAPGRITVVTNGVDPDRFSPAPADDALKRRLGLSGKFVCSYLGTIGMACGLDVVLRAATTLKERGRTDVAFLLVGDGTRRRTLAKAARAHGLDNVIFTGRQPKEKMPAYLSISDCCLVHLRKTDLFTTVLPSKVFEAGAMARPVILGVAGHAARLLRTSGGGICIEPENDAELVDAVVRLRHDKGLRARLGHAGREHVLEHFDGDRLAADYLRLIDDVCRRAATGRARAPAAVVQSSPSPSTRV